jgi:hypothetical protein
MAETDEELLTFDISDDALERAAPIIGGVASVVTLNFVTAIIGNAPAPFERTHFERKCVMGVVCKNPHICRGLLKAQKILTRLGARPDIFKPFPEKPPRMHWRTYERLHRAYEIAKHRSIRGVLGGHPAELL